MDNNTAKAPVNESVQEARDKLLRVSKSELTSGNQTGEVYVQLSKGAAFLLTERKDAIKFVEKEATKT
jgi:hypothetical protein